MGKKRAEGTSSTTASTAAPKAPVGSAAAPKPSVAMGAAPVAAGRNLQCDWDRSTISKRDENRMRRMGLISAAERDTKIPGSESRPKPPAGFNVMFLAFLLRGLSLPAHKFLRCLLFTYGIQLWQLTPNSILHLAIFITLCESFLGIEPLWALWKKIFFVKRLCNTNGPYVVGGVGFVVRKEVKYFKFPMKESVQGWRQKWFYIRDQPMENHPSGLPPFKDVLEAKPKKSWRNVLTAEERPIAEDLYERILELKESGGQMMIGTEIAALFLKRRVQPLMARSHPMYLYTGPKDSTRVSAVDFTDKELLDEVRRLTLFSQDDNIPIDSLQDPFDAGHLPTEGTVVARSFPPSPESGELPNRRLLQLRQGQQVSSPMKMICYSDLMKERWNLRPPKKQKASSEATVATRVEISPVEASAPPEDTPAAPLPSKRALKKRKASASDEHPIFAAVNTVSDFASQFVKLEAENARLREELTTAKTSTEQVESANKLAAEAWQRAEDLEKELGEVKAKLENELSDVKAKLEGEVKLREEAQSLMEKREDRLRKSAESLLGAADAPVDRSSKLRVDSMADAISFSVDSNEQVQSLLKKAKAALSKLYALVFPKLSQDKTLEKLTEAFFVDNEDSIEVLKRTSRIYGALIAFQLLMGYGVEAKFEELSKALPKKEDGTLVDLNPFTRSARVSARQLIDLVEANKRKGAAKTAPSASGQTSTL